MILNNTQRLVETDLLKLEVDDKNENENSSESKDINEIDKFKKIAKTRINELENIGNQIKNDFENANHKKELNKLENKIKDELKNLRKLF